MITGITRLLWGYLEEPYIGLSRIPRFKMEILQPKSDTETENNIRAAISDAVIEGLGDIWRGASIENIMLPIRDGDKPRLSGQLPDPRCAGCMVITASSSIKPKVFDISMRRIKDPKAIYNGMYLCASLSFAPYIYEGTPGVRAIIGPLIKVMDGAFIEDLSPAEQALSNTAKKLHRQMISGMTGAAAEPSPPIHTDADVPHDILYSRDMPPTDAELDFLNQKDEQEAARGAASQTSSEVSPEISEAAKLETLLEKHSKKSVSLEEFKTLMQEPA